MKYLTKINTRDIIIVVGILVAILISISTQWAKADIPLRDMVLSQNIELGLG